MPGPLCYMNSPWHMGHLALWNRRETLVNFWYSDKSFLLAPFSLSVFYGHERLWWLVVDMASTNYKTGLGKCSPEVFEGMKESLASVNCHPPDALGKKVVFHSASLTAVECFQTYEDWTSRWENNFTDTELCALVLCLSFLSAGSWAPKPWFRFRRIFFFFFFFNYSESQK